MRQYLGLFSVKPPNYEPNYVGKFLASFQSFILGQVVRTPPPPAPRVLGRDWFSGSISIQLQVRIWNTDCFSQTSIKNQTGNVTLIILLGLSVAFSTLNHSILLNCLSALELKGAFKVVESQSQKLVLGISCSVPWPFGCFRA